MVRIPGISAGEIRSVAIGSNAWGEPETTFLGTIDEIKFFREPLSDQEVEAEYRRFAPFDLYLDRALYRNPREIELELARPDSGAGNDTSIVLSLVDKEGKSVAIVDLDIVNPYFRTADFSEMLENNGIRVIVPMYANSNLDIPALTGAVDDLDAKLSKCIEELKAAGLDTIMQEAQKQIDEFFK